MLTRPDSLVKLLDKCERDIEKITSYDPVFFEWLDAKLLHILEKYKRKGVHVSFDDEKIRAIKSKVNAWLGKHAAAKG